MLPHISKPHGSGLKALPIRSEFSYSALPTNVEMLYSLPSTVAMIQRPQLVQFRFGWVNLGKVSIEIIEKYVTKKRTMNHRITQYDSLKYAICKNVGKRVVLEKVLAYKSFQKFDVTLYTAQVSLDELKNGKNPYRKTFFKNKTYWLGFGETKPNLFCKKNQVHFRGFLRLNGV